MNGRVKITVIATGFDRPGAVPAVRETSRTPVDMNAYASWKEEVGERAAAAGGSRMVVARRPALDLPPIAPPQAGPDESAAGAEFEPASPLDVPAFLRRQHEA